MLLAAYLVRFGTFDSLMELTGVCTAELLELRALH